MTVEELYKMDPEVSRTVLYETITNRLKFRKLYARWAPKMFTDEHKANQVCSANEFLDRYEEKGESFIDFIVTGANMG